MRQPDELAVLCSVPSSVRLASPQRCSPARNGRFARPCDRSTYTYMSSGRSPARLVSFSQVPPRWRRRSKPRLAPLVEFGAVLAVSASLPLHAPPLPPSSRRYAPQCFVGGYASSPCDVSHRASSEPRRRMSLSSALAPSSLASPSTRRVFLRSICVRRRSVSELNNSCIPHEAVGRVELISGCCGGLKGFNM